MAKETSLPSNEKEVEKFEQAFGIKVVQINPVIIQTKNGKQWRPVADFEELRDIRILGERFIQTGSLCWVSTEYKKPQ